MQEFGSKFKEKGLLLTMGQLMQELKLFRNSNFQGYIGGSFPL